MSEHGIEAAGRSNLVEGVQAAQEDDQKREYRIVSFSLKKKNNILTFPSLEKKETME